MRAETQDDGDRSPGRWYRARQVFPLSAPPIEDGLLEVVSGRIRRVGPRGDLAANTHGRVVDLGDSAVLPGLVNAHTHLDYTGLAGELPPPPGFVPWIEAIQAAKASLGPAERSEHWLQGAAALARSGVTTVGDFEAWPDLLLQVLRKTPLRTVSFIELISLQESEDPLGPWRVWLEVLARETDPRRRAGLAPHAPYSTTPALLRACAEEARRRGWPVAIHLAESREEFEMFRHGRGPLKEWLAARGRRSADLGGLSPVAAVAQTGLLGPRTLAIHVNYLASGDAERLARSGATVVHCPRSHAYFGHDPFPMRELRAAGVPVAVGTDSAATVAMEDGVPPLDLWVELAWLARTDPGLEPEHRLAMVTTVPARALGWAGEVGELCPGAWADLLVVPAERALRDTLAAVAEGARRPGAVMLGGEWVETTSATMEAGE